MIVAPWLVGASLRAQAGQPAWAAEIGLLAFWVAAFLLFQAASMWLKASPSRRSLYGAPVLTYAAIAASLGVPTLWLLGIPALGWGIGFAPLLAVALWLAWRRDERSMIGGVVTIAAASLLGMVARYPVPQVPDAIATAALGSVFLYFVGTVFYVKTMIRERHKLAWRWASAFFHLLTMAACWAWWARGGPASLSWLALVFALLTVRAIAVPLIARRRAVTPKAIGIGEIVATVAVVSAAVIPLL